MSYEEMYNFLSGPQWSNSDRRKMIETFIEFFGLTDDIRKLVDEFEINLIWV